MPDPRISRHRSPRPLHRPPVRRDLVVFLVLLAVVAWVGWRSSSLLVADLQAMAPRFAVRSWAEGRAEWTMAAWVQAHDATLAAWRRTPDDPALCDQLAVLHLIRARAAWRSATAQRELYAEAAVWQRRSLALRPVHGWTWAGLAESLQALAPASAGAWDAWRQALRYAPHEATVQASLCRTVRLAGDQVPQDARNWAASVPCTGVPAPRR